MFLFDWMKIYNASHGNVREIVRIFRMLVEKQVPKNRNDPIYKYSHKNFVGSSFLVHGEFLLFNSYKYTNKELCIYYALASLRSYADYITYNKTTLDSLHCPVPLDEINDNRLLIVLEDEITFIYEEVTLETIH